MLRVAIHVNKIRTRQFIRWTRNFSELAELRQLLNSFRTCWITIFFSSTYVVVILENIPTVHGKVSPRCPGVEFQLIPDQRFVSRQYFFVSYVHNYILTVHSITVMSNINENNLQTSAILWVRTFVLISAQPSSNGPQNCLYKYEFVRQ